MLRRLLVPALVVLAACDNAGEDRLLDVDASGRVAGAVFLDLDASGTPGAADAPASNLQIALVSAGTADTVARVRTDADGVFDFGAVAAGTYDVVVPAGGLGDSIAVVFRDPPGLPIDQIDPDDDTSITVGRNDSIDVEIGVGYHVVSVEEARMLPAGRRVIVRGTALSGIGAVGDGALYLQGESRAIRVTSATGDAVVPGDTVFALGTVGVRDGQPALIGGNARIDGSDGAVDTVLLAAGDARTADGGAHDAQLIRLAAVLVTDTATVATRFVVTVEDPSGTVDVIVPGAAAFPEAVPGNELDIVGLLVPAPGVASTWQVRPRSPDDVNVRL